MTPMPIMKGEEEMHGGYNPDVYWEMYGGADYFNVWLPGRDDGEPDERRFLKAAVAKVRPETLLDFGCGPGTKFDLWADVPIVFAFDRSHAMIDYARNMKWGYRLDTGSGEDRTKTPYPDQKFDLVVACSVLIHVENIAGMVTELHRICRGYLAIGTSVEFTEVNARCHNHDYNVALRGLFEVAEDYTAGNYRFILAKRVTQSA